MPDSTQEPASATGLTKDAGWELGVRTTVAAPVEVVWDYLLGAGLRVWLGELDALPLEKGDDYATADGVRGTVRIRSEGSRIRISWQPDDWPHDSTVQLTIKPVASGTTIGIHHERLADREERRMMLGHWKNVAAAFDSHFAAG